MRTWICLAAILSVAGGAAACRAQTAHRKTAAEYEAEADALLAKAAAQGAGTPGASIGSAATAPQPGAAATVRPAQPVTAPTTGGGLVAGRYTCIAGYGPMLTLGEMTITGGAYRFHAPTGADTAGSYAMSGGAIRWSGDIGAIRNARITQSGLDAHKPDFWFKFYAYDGAKLPTTAACQKL